MSRKINRELICEVKQSIIPKMENKKYTKIKLENIFLLSEKFFQKTIDKGRKRW